MVEYKTIPQLLDEIKSKIKTENQALQDGVEAGYLIRLENEKIIDKEVDKFLKDPDIYLIKKALYYLEFTSVANPENREKYFYVLEELADRIKNRKLENYVNNSDS